MLSGISKLLLIRDNEKWNVMYFFSLFAVLGCGVAFGRNSTDVLFFKRFGVDYLPLMYVLLSLFLALTSLIYAVFADRISPEKLSIAIFSSLIILLIINWAWITFDDSHAAYPAYFLLYEVASEVLIIHSAHYLAQNFDSLQAKRLYPIIMAGMQVGIIIGSIMLAISAEYIAMQQILLAWCILLFISVLMIYYWHKQRGISKYFRPVHKSNNKFKQAVSQITYGFTLMKTSQMLRAASFALFFMVITFYILCYSVNRIYTHTFTSEAELSRFFGILTATTNSIALLLQIFVTNRVIHRFGVKKVNLFFPITSMVSYLTLLFSYSLGPAILGSINKDAIMPAFRNPVRVIFFNALPENVQGRARATSIAIVLPLALFICGIMLIFMLKFGTQNYFLVLGIISAILYLFYNYKMNKAYINEILSTLKSKVLMPSVNDFEMYAGQDSKKSEHFKNGAAAKLFKILMDSYPHMGYELLSAHAGKSENYLINQLILILRTINPQGFSDVLWELYNEQEDDYLKSTILTTLFMQYDHRVMDSIPALLNGSNYHLKIPAIIGALHQDNQPLRCDAIQQWHKLLCSDGLEEQTASFELLEYLYLAPNDYSELLPEYKTAIINILNRGETEQVNSALSALLCWPEHQFHEISNRLTEIYNTSNAVTRLLCVQCTRLFYFADQTLLESAIEDNNTHVRKEAARVHYEMAGEGAEDVLAIWLSTEANGSPLIQNAYISLMHEVSTDGSQFEKIALQKAELAKHFFFGHQLLSKYSGVHSAAYQIVTYILQERIKQYMELSVHAIQGFENDDDTKLLCTCINSKDPRHIANACEVLRNFKHRKLGEILSDLVDQNPIKYDNLHNPKFTYSVKSVLQWCMNLPDPWLSLCAKEALNTLA